MDHKTIRMVRVLMRIGACRESLRWVKRSGFVTRQELWQGCNNPEWLLWYLRHSRASQWAIDSVQECIDHFDTIVLDVSEVLNHHDEEPWDNGSWPIVETLEKMCADRIRSIVPIAPLLNKSARASRYEDDIPF